MSIEPDQELLEIYFEEAEEHLDELARLILEMEANGTEPSILDETYRRAHSLKGSSNLVGFTDASRVAHLMEDIFDAIRSRKSVYDETKVDTLLRAINVLKDWLDRKKTTTDYTTDFSKISLELETALPPALGHHQKDIDEILAKMSPELGRILLEQDIKSLEIARQQGEKIFEITINVKKETFLEEIKRIASVLNQVGRITVKARSAIQKKEEYISLKILFTSKQKITNKIESLSDVNFTIDELKVTNEEIDISEFFGNDSKSSSDLVAAPQSSTDKPRTPSSCPSAVSSLKEVDVGADTYLEASKANPQVKIRHSPSRPIKTSGQEETLRVKLKKIDDIVNVASELLVRTDDEKHVVQELGLSSQLAHQLLRSFISTRDEIHLRFFNKANSTNGSIAKRLADITLKLTELEERLSQLDLKARDDFVKSETIITDLQTKVMNVRMMPVSTLFQKFQQLIRSLSKEQGKKIRLEIQGDTNELDKNVLDEISDPLNHILRNCVDHGIETSDERQACGKPEMATIRLEAIQMGNEMIVQVQDDGRGIDAAKVRDCAIKKGILKNENAQQLSKNELLELIFAPGFSTAEKVTQISGRGVGLDVVKTNIEKLNGSINVETHQGSGTTFILRVPITLALMRALVINVKGLTFAVPASVVDRIFKIDDSEMVSLKGKKAIIDQGTTLPSIALSEIMGIDWAGRNGRQQTALIVSSVGRQICFLVDKVERVQDIVFKGFDEIVSPVPFLSGGCIMMNGRVVAILDILSLADKVFSNSLQVMPKKSRAITDQGRSTIMVVDDSKVTRDMLVNILKSSGFNVVDAANGVEALSKLGRIRCDLIITDVNMPDMSGLELTTILRNDESLSTIPVVILTNKEGEQDRQQSIEVGANVYMLKSDFDQKNLVAKIVKLLKSNQHANEKTA